MLLLLLMAHQVHVKLRNFVCCVYSSPALDLWSVKCAYASCGFFTFFSPLVHYDVARGAEREGEEGGSCHYVNWLSESSVIEVQTHFWLNLVHKLLLWFYF